MGPKGEAVEAFLEQICYPNASKREILPLAEAFSLTFLSILYQKRLIRNRTRLENSGMRQKGSRVGIPYCSNHTANHIYDLFHCRVFHSTPCMYGLWWAWAHRQSPHGWYVSCAYQVSGHAQSTDKHSQNKQGSRSMLYFVKADNTWKCSYLSWANAA